MDLQKEYERIQKYAQNAIGKKEKYDMSTTDMAAMRTCCDDLYDMMYTAFNYGFEKGCRATKKAASV